MGFVLQFALILFSRFHNIARIIITRSAFLFLFFKSHIRVHEVIETQEEAINN